MSTRQNILETLTKIGPMKASELAVSLDLIPADIRYQLKRLINAGQVHSQHIESTPSRGRPSATYQIVSEISQVNAIVLVEIMVNLLINEFPNLFYIELAEKIWGQTKKDINLSPIPYVRLTQILKFLQSIGVQATWEAGKSGPTIKVTHNPYALKTNPRPFELIADSLVHLALQEATRG